jgi:hypothetical protein
MRRPTAGMDAGRYARPRESSQLCSKIDSTGHCTCICPSYRGSGVVFEQARPGRPTTTSTQPRRIVDHQQYRDMMNHNEPHIPSIISNDFDKSTLSGAGGAVPSTPKLTAKSASCPISKSKNCVLVNMAKSSSKFNSELAAWRSWAVGIALRFAMYSDTLGPLLPLYAMMLEAAGSCLRRFEAVVACPGSNK